MQSVMKQNIVKAAQDYMAANGMTAENLHRLSGVSQSYLSSMLAGKMTVGAAGKETEIADKWFFLLAAAVRFDTGKVYWKTVTTKQMRQIITALEVARDNGRMTTIICPTGMGKTHCINMFKHSFPKDVFVITINSLVKLHDVIRMLCEALGISTKDSKALKLRNIILKLREMKLAGLKPTIIFDEAENMEHSLVKLMKGLFDGLNGYATIAQIGTDQLLTKMSRAKNSNMDGGPQYYRRFKSSITPINTIVSFDLFFKELGIMDVKVQRLLERECENYGELHDYLEPVLREADLRELPVTVELFQTIYTGMAA